MSASEKYFSWYDAWAIMSIMWSIDEEGEIDVLRIEQLGDMLNHAILLNQELKDGFYKAQKKGLIKVSQKRMQLTEMGIFIRDKIRNGRSGMFRSIGDLEKKLNSKRTKLQEVDESEIDRCEFLD